MLIQKAYSLSFPPNLFPTYNLRMIYSHLKEGALDIAKKEYDLAVLNSEYYNLNKLRLNGKIDPVRFDYLSSLHQALGKEGPRPTVPNWKRHASDKDQAKFQEKRSKLNQLFPTSAEYAKPNDNNPNKVPQIRNYHERLKQSKNQQPSKETSQIHQPSAYEMVF